jgi:hypothetical protein
MRATEHDPWIGVHTLTEFIFCPRAGLIQHEREDLENDEEPDTPRLSYLADWNEIEIERNLKQLINRLWFWMGIFIIVGLVFLFFHGPWVFTAVIGELIVFKFLISNLINVIKLTKRLNKARCAPPNEPPDELKTDYEVNWWSLLKVGYESIRYKESLRDPAWRLAGKPWRVLRKGDKRIPVFRMRSGEQRVYPQHRARMAAYCHLIEQSEGAKSPYGVIIYPKSYDGIAIANAPSARKIFHDGLRNARSLIIESNNCDPPRPYQKLCLNCPCGKPFFDGTEYSSDCGNRFKWVPPHSKSIEKGLL